MFEVVWRELSEVIGTTATAMLLRSAAKNAALRGGYAGGLTIAREGYEYRYSLDETWTTGNGSSVASLHVLLAELRPLLVALTGPVLVRRLAASALPEIARVFEGKESP